MKDLIKKIIERALHIYKRKCRSPKKCLVGVGISIGALALVSVFLSGNTYVTTQIINGFEKLKGEQVQDEDAASQDFTVVTRMMRDKEGKLVPEGTRGAKYTSDYTCEDFRTQLEAQRFLMIVGGSNEETRALDSDRDNEACESLPKNRK